MSPQEKDDFLQWKQKIPHKTWFVHENNFSMLKLALITHNFSWWLCNCRTMRHVTCIPSTTDVISEASWSCLNGSSARTTGKRRYWGEEGRSWEWEEQREKNWKMKRKKLTVEVEMQEKDWKNAREIVLRRAHVLKRAYFYITLVYYFWNNNN